MNPSDDTKQYQPSRHVHCNDVALYLSTSDSDPAPERVVGAPYRLAHAGKRGSKYTVLLEKIHCPICLEIRRLRSACCVVHGTTCGTRMFPVLCITFHQPQRSVHRDRAAQDEPANCSGQKICGKRKRGKRKKHLPLSSIHPIGAVSGPVTQPQSAVRRETITRRAVRCHRSVQTHDQQPS